MTPVIRTAHAWMLTLLLLSGFVTPRVCQAHPAEPTRAAAQVTTCCDHDAPASGSSSENTTPRRAPTDPPAPDDHRPSPGDGCDCPFGCCAPALAKAITADAGPSADAPETARWDLAGAGTLPVPNRDGPKRPPRF
jgi:hypothetical protein